MLTTGPLFTSSMHPLVRDLYKRAIIVGKDYPHPGGINFVKEQWKKALRDPQNATFEIQDDPTQREKELRKVIGKGRYAIREMIGVIQLKKYRTMRRRYNGGLLDIDGESERIVNACREMSRRKND